MATARRNGGVTLLELLVALAIVGIIAAVGLPSYRMALLRAHRVEAIDALLAIAAAQERFHLQHGRYAAHLDDGAAGGGPSLAIAAISSGGRYRLALAEAGSIDFVASATPTEESGQAADLRCASLSLRANGERRAADRHGADSTRACWN